jgi:uncharacterized protein YqhQ
MLKIFDSSKKGLTFKDLGIFLVITLVLAVSVFLIDSYANFLGEEVVDTLLGSGILLIIFIVIIYVLVNSINVKRINEKIKDRNK